MTADELHFDRRLPLLSIVRVSWRLAGIRRAESPQPRRPGRVPTIGCWTPWSPTDRDASESAGSRE